MDIRLYHINKSYGKQKVLDNLSLVIKEHAITCLMGPSGCGKTTLSRILSGLETADSGTIVGLKDKRLSMVFQENRLCENLSAAANIKLICPKEITKEQIEEELKQLNLTSALHKPVRELSGGMKRRVAFLRALMCPFDFLILDEPLKELDEETKQIVTSYLMKKTEQKTVLFITHDKREAEALHVDEILFLPQLNTIERK